MWTGNYTWHGLSISNDGNRAYLAAGNDNGVLILDVSEIQARMPNPQVREVGRVSWPNQTIPQNAIPITIRDHPYVVEIDGEQHRFDAMMVAVGNGPSFGGGLRITEGAVLDDGLLFSNFADQQLHLQRGATAPIAITAKPQAAASRSASGEKSFLVGRTNASHAATSCRSSGEFGFMSRCTSPSAWAAATSPLSTALPSVAPSSDSAAVSSLGALNFNAGDVLERTIRVDEEPFWAIEVPAAIKPLISK